MNKEDLKKYKRILRFYLIKAIIKGIGLLPTSKINKLKMLLVKSAYLFGKKDIAIAKSLIPEEFNSQKEKIIRGMLENASMVILEVVLYDKLSKENPNYCKFEGMEIIEDIIKKGQVPCILSGHFGNWEVLGYELVKKGLDLSVIARAQNLGKMTDFINDFRIKRGMNVVMHDNILESTKLLKNGKPVAILADLNAREWGYQVDFFGRNASFYSAPVIISMRSKMPLVPAFSERQPDGTFIMRILPPIEWHKNESMRDRVQKIAKVYEEEFRKRPDLWCWYHARYDFAEMGKL